ncbi:hypothetical protein SH467x_000769 [Pirellulaceae bacterium SH467]
MIDVERVVTLDELMDRVPEHLVRDAESRSDKTEAKTVPSTRPDNMSKEPSKAQRIRSFLEENPEARNKDVVVALEKYNVTAADVANVKSQMKRAEAAVPSSRRKIEGAVAPDVASDEPGPNLNLKHLEAAVEFVKLAGSVQAAQHLLIIVDRIKGA